MCAGHQTREDSPASYTSCEDDSRTQEDTVDSTDDIGTHGLCSTTFNNSREMQHRHGVGSSQFWWTLSLMLLFYGRQHRSAMPCIDGRRTRIFNIGGDRAWQHQHLDVCLPSFPRSHARYPNLFQSTRIRSSLSAIYSVTRFFYSQMNNTFFSLFSPRPLSFTGYDDHELTMVSWVLLWYRYTQCVCTTHYQEYPPYFVNLTH